MKENQERELDVVQGVVLCTNDYSKFKLLEGNRPILERRKQRIRKSVRSHGQIHIPIIVNEKMEIIDGQGRFEVFKEMGLPIYYVIVNGLKLEDCVALNSVNGIWTLQEYVDCYAMMGNENYIRLNFLIKAHKRIPINAITFAAVGIVPGNTVGTGNADIKGGGIIISDEQFMHAESLLGYAEKFLPSFKTGNRSYLLIASMFCHDVDGVDKERLVEKWDKYGNIKTVNVPAISVRDAIRCLENAYNFKSHAGTTMYFEAEYDKRCRSNSAAYMSRWAAKKKEQ